MEIPVNNYDDAALVDKLTDEIMVSMEKRDDYGHLRAIDYDKETLRKVLDRFKEKGYFCYYERRFDGEWIALAVSRKPVPTDGCGLNRTVKY